MTPINHIDEKDLLLRLQCGDHKAFEILYHQHSRELQSQLVGKFIHREDMDDLVQGLFVKVWERRHQIDPTKPFGGYLYRIAQRMVADFYRKNGTTNTAWNEVRLNSSDVSLYTDQAIEARETQQLIEQAIERLPPQQKRAFNLCKIEGLSHKEAAQIMEVSPKTLNAHLVKANQSVKSYFQNAQAHIPGTLAVALVLYCA